MNNVRLAKPKNRAELEKMIRLAGPCEAGAVHMLPKAELLLVFADGLSAPAAGILKQELLSRGGEAVNHREVLVNKIERSTVLLMGTRAQLAAACKNLKKQQFGLPELARQLEQVLEVGSRESFCVPHSKGVLEMGKDTVVMGILNITPDSFSDGGCFNEHKRAIERGISLFEQGAAIIDIGGESTRPGFVPVSAEEEKKRILPVISGLAAVLDIPVSVDTSKAEVAQEALAAGAGIINDIGGLQQDPQMAEVAALAQAPVIIMHNPQEMTPEDGDIMADVCRFFYRSLAIGKNAGMSDDMFILDPGLGFKKTAAQNMQIIRRLDELSGFGLPVLVGPSRKSFIGAALSVPVEERLPGTVAAAVLSAVRGANVLRVHDVAEILEVLKMSAAILNS